MRVSIGRWFKSGSKDFNHFADGGVRRSAAPLVTSVLSLLLASGSKKFRYRESNPSLLGESQKS